MCGRAGDPGRPTRERGVCGEQDGEGHRDRARGIGLRAARRGHCGQWRPGGALWPGLATYKVRERLQDPGIVPALKPGVTYTDNLRLLKPGHLLACWPLDEASGAVAYDSSGNARNGANTGVTPGAAGIGDGATVYSFDGVGDRVNVYSASLAGAFHAEEGTLLAWVKVSAAGIWTDGAYHWCVNLGVD